MFLGCSEISIRAIVKHVNIYVQYIYMYISDNSVIQCNMNYLLQSF